MIEQTKLSRLQRQILVISFLSGGRIAMLTLRRRIYGETLNARKEKSNASSLARAVTRLSERGLTRRHYVGGMALTKSGAILAVELTTNPITKKGK